MFDAPGGPYVVPYGDPDGGAPPHLPGTVIRIAYNPAHPSDVIIDSPREIVLGGVFFLAVFALTVAAVLLFRS